jgi:hypothetical protein
MRRIATNGQTEGANAEMAGMWTKRRNCMKIGSADDAGVVKMNGEAQLSPRIAEKVLKQIMKKRRNIKQTAYERKNKNSREMKETENETEAVKEKKRKIFITTVIRRIGMM